MSVIYLRNDMVICDICNKDYTNSEVSGGFLFGSYAVCPECAKRMIKTIKENNEEQYIKKRCGDNQSFRNFVYEIRNNSI